MKYKVEIAQTEREILRRMIGKPINRILVYDVYSVRFLVSAQVIDFTPLEVSTPSSESPLTNVTRPIITTDQSQLRKDLDWDIFLENIENIEEISLLNSIVTFTDTQDKNTVDAVGIDVGGKNRWYHKLHNPSVFISKDLIEQKAYVSLDIGIALITNDNVITISTDSLGYGVDIKIGDTIPKKLLAYVTKKPL